MNDARTLHEMRAYFALERKYTNDELRDGLRRVIEIVSRAHDDGELWRAITHIFREQGRAEVRVAQGEMAATMNEHDSTRKSC